MANLSPRELLEVLKQAERATLALEQLTMCHKAATWFLTLTGDHSGQKVRIRASAVEAISASDAGSEVSTASGLVYYVRETPETIGERLTRVRELVADATLTKGVL